VVGALALFASETPSIGACAAVELCVTRTCAGARGNSYRGSGVPAVGTVNMDHASPNSEPRFGYHATAPILTANPEKSDDRAAKLECMDGQQSANNRKGHARHTRARPRRSEIADQPPLSRWFRRRRASGVGRCVSTGPLVELRAIDSARVLRGVRFQPSSG
jgi:hypothetical protein